MGPISFQFFMMSIILIALTMYLILYENISEKSELTEFLEPFVDQGEKAFFLETKGDNSLNYRQACAVESLALLNPDLPVYVLFANEHFDDTTVTLNTLQQYKNIKLVHINLEEYVAKTPLESWNRDSGWKQGPYRASHLSDGLRMLTLFKYGGYYFDLDIIFTRPVKYYRNFAATEDENTLNGAALHAEKGYPFLKMAIEEFVNNYNRNAWSHNGPGLVTRILKKWCGVEKLSEMDYVRCKGFTILPKASFYPLHYSAWDQYFRQQPVNDLGKPNWLTDKVIGMHVWNKLSAENPVFKNSTQYYTQFAKTQCPVVFAVAPEVF